MRSYAGLKAAAGFRDELLLPLLKGVGVYNGNDLSAVAAFNTWLGHNAALQIVFFDSSSWTNFANGINYETNLFTGLNCIWSVPLAAQQGTLPAVACAKSILANAPANQSIIIRLGWEFNLLSSPSRAFDGSGNPIPATWVSAYQHVVNIFRTTSQRFRFVWCPNIDNASSNGLTITDCYPGDMYVDYVGVDSYFSSAYDSVSDQGAGYFGYVKAQGAGYDWLVAFASTHGKAWCIPEWGVDSDAATAYMADFCAYLVANNCAFTGYWNSNSAFAGQLSGNQYPDLSTIYLKYFGLPVIINNNFSTIQSTAGSVPLTTNQDGTYTITWSITGGADAGSFSISGSTLSWGSIAAGTKVVIIQATDSAGYTSSKTLTVTFGAAYTFTNTEASALVARMTTTPPTEDRKALIDTYIGALKTAGVWALMDTLYVLAAQDATDALLNWVQNTNTAAGVNSPAFVVNKGYTGSPYSAYVTTNRPGNASGHYTTNSASFGVWELTNISTGSGVFAGGGVASLNGRSASNQVSFSVNDYTGTTYASTNSQGFWVGNRSASAARQFYLNGASIGSDTVSSNAPSSAPFIISATNTSYPDSHQVALAFTGGSMTSTQIGNLYTATYNYLHAIGTV
jgi:hypothetical protein